MPQARRGVGGSAHAGSAVSSSKSRFAFAISALAALALWAGSAGCASQPLRPGDAATGQALYQERCGACHRLFEPVEFDRDMWKIMVRRMAPDAGLNKQQRADVLAWLLPQAPEHATE